MKHTPSYVDPVEFERRLRAANEAPLPPEFEKDPVMSVQYRARDVHVPFALWVIGESNRSTPTNHLIEAAGNMLASLVVTVEKHIGGVNPETGMTSGDAVVAQMLAVLEHWATEEKEGDGSFSIRVPYNATEGGNA